MLAVQADREMIVMAHTLDDLTKERIYVGAATHPRENTVAWLPDPPDRAGHGQEVIQFILAMTIFGTVIPPDLYFVNWLFGDPFPALRDPMVINALVTISAVLAVPVIPLTLLALLAHRRHVARGGRESVG